jgi:hypothetical protein
MTRRKTKHRTGLPRIKGIGTKVHNAWIGYVCINCETLNLFSIGNQLLDPNEVYRTAQWECRKCNYLHSKDSPLPFKEWPSDYTDPNSIKCQRFWQAFFRIATENKEAYWKQCNACGRILPSNAFSRHSGWGPLEKQMECRSCKGAINAYLNPKRTKQQLYESNIKRRVGDLLLEGENQPIDKNFIDDLFRRFNGRCFKTGVRLDKRKRNAWEIDHILPSSWLYPLTKENAALLSKEANNNKRNKWPSHFYTNNELIKLAKITGGDLALFSKKEPVVNPNINVDKCVTRYLQVREHSRLDKRIRELKKLLRDYGLIDKLSTPNKKLLGYI